MWLTTPLGAQTSFDWLNDAVHPRGMALAHATVAAADPAEALSLNPAGLRFGSDTLLFMGKIVEPVWEER